MIARGTSHWRIQIREGGSHPDPKMKGLRSPKNFFRPFGSQFGLKIMWASPLVPALQVVVSIRQPSSNSTRLTKLADHRNLEKLVWSIKARSFNV